MVPEILAILRGMVMVLVVLAIKVLIAPRGFPCHLIWPPKVWLVLDLLQNPMYWLSEYSVDSLHVGCSRWPYEVPPWVDVVIPV